MGKPLTRVMARTIASGRRFGLLDPSPSEVDFRDIAAHLAKICRFGGAPYSFFSFAQHAVLVAGQLPPTLRPYGLLSQAHVAYVGDLDEEPGLALAFLGGERAIGTLVAPIAAAIHAAAGLPWPRPREIAEEVRQAELRAYATEVRDLLPAQALPLPCRPMGTRIRPWPWAKAEERFLDALNTSLPAGMRSVA